MRGTINLYCFQAIAHLEKLKKNAQLEGGVMIKRERSLCTFQSPLSGKPSLSHSTNNQRKSLSLHIKSNCLRPKYGKVLISRRYTARALLLLCKSTRKLHSHRSCRELLCALAELHIDPQFLGKRQRAAFSAPAYLLGIPP